MAQQPYLLSQQQQPQKVSIQHQKMQQQQQYYPSIQSPPSPPARYRKASFAYSKAQSPTYFFQQPKAPKTQQSLFSQSPNQTSRVQTQNSPKQLHKKGGQTLTTTPRYHNLNSKNSKNTKINNKTSVSRSPSDQSNCLKQQLLYQQQYAATQQLPQISRPFDTTLQHQQLTNNNSNSHANTISNAQVVNLNDQNQLQINTVIIPTPFSTLQRKLKQPILSPMNQMRINCSSPMMYKLKQRSIERKRYAQNNSQLSTIDQTKIKNTHLLSPKRQQFCYEQPSPRNSPRGTTTTLVQYPGNNTSITSACPSTSPSGPLELNNIEKTTFQFRNNSIQPTNNQDNYQNLNYTSMTNKRYPLHIQNKQIKQQQNVTVAQQQVHPGTTTLLSPRPSRQHVVTVGGPNKKERDYNAAAKLQQNEFLDNDFIILPDQIQSKLTNPLTSLSKRDQQARTSNTPHIMHNRRESSSHFFNKISEHSQSPHISPRPTITNLNNLNQEPSLDTIQYVQETMGVSPMSNFPRDIKPVLQQKKEAKKNLERLQELKNKKNQPPRGTTGESMMTLPEEMGNYSIGGTGASRGPAHHTAIMNSVDSFRCRSSRGEKVAVQQ